LERTLSQRVSILIVEDEAIVALDLKQQLVGLGYEIVGMASSGEQAMELVAKRTPGLLLMDVRLQGDLDGIEVAEAILRDHHVPVIFLTSHSDDETVRRAALTAPYGYLTKPFQLRELRAGIEVALTKAGMERQLKEADRWFANTLQCVSDGVIVTDQDARIRFVNPAAEKLIGWSLEECQGRDVSDIVRIAAVPRIPDSTPTTGTTSRYDEPNSIVRSVLKLGRPTPVAHALKLTARGGVPRLVDETVGPIDDDSGGRLGAVVVLRDASARVAQEGQLRQSEERFRSAFDNAPLGMILVSLSGAVLQVNDALGRMLGTPAEELKRLDHDALIVEADREHEAQRLAELLNAGRGVVQYEKRYVRGGGMDPLWTLVSVSLLHESERPTCYLFQVHDLTEQKRAAEQLAELAAERMKRQASDLAAAAKGEFLSRVSHEMRTPLNAVIGFASLLKLQGSADDKRIETYAHHIQAAGEHLLVMVTDLLELNGGSDGTLQMKPQATGLAAAADEVLLLLEPLSRAHGISVRSSIGVDLIVVADPVRLRQVVLNIVSNAIKYNRQGGCVDLRAEMRTPGRILLGIEDHGIGMTPSQLDRLFQPFDRLGQERTKIPGTGLGLVIAKAIVAQMDGSLRVVSEPRVGTTVSVELPAAVLTST
jgi:PAS domain S-box-containing protein